MPQACDEDRAWAIERVGSIDTAGPIKMLTIDGWTLTHDWCWQKPSPEHVPTDEECQAIGFLIDEWDFGGIE